MRLAWIAVAAAISAPAGAQTLAPGDYEFGIRSGGRDRSYLAHVPPQANSSALPLVVSLHGGGGNARQHRRMSGMDAAADRDGYIVAYPNGSGPLQDRLLTWNAGDCCGYAQKENIDDVAFVSGVVDDLSRRAAVDRGRVYVVGHSNGGMLAHRLGAAMPGHLAAIASVAGARIPPAGSGRAVPVLHIHSVDDPRALYHGGLGPPFPMTNNRVQHVPVEQTIAAWIARDGCDPAPREIETREADGHTARLYVYRKCRDGAEVALWKLTGAGHGWPGAAQTFEGLLGPATRVIDANREIWRFLSRFRLPN